MIRVRFFASYRDLPGCRDFEVPLAEVRPPTVEGLFALSCVGSPDLEFHRNRALIAVNQQYARWDEPLSDGDEVAFFPPVSGGAR